MNLPINHKWTTSSLRDRQFAALRRRKIPYGIFVSWVFEDLSCSWSWDPKTHQYMIDECAKGSYMLGEVISEVWELLNENIMLR